MYVLLCTALPCAVSSPHVSISPVQSAVPRTEVIAIEIVYIDTGVIGPVYYCIVYVLVITLIAAHFK